MVRLPSASKVQLAMTCQASAVLPRIERLNGFSDEGKAIHEYMRDLASMPREEALKRVAPQYRARCEAIDLSALPLNGFWRAEAAFAYDVAGETVRFLGFDVGRNYGPREPSEMFLSIDAIIELPEEPGTVLLVDWKSGRGKLVPAADAWQLRVAALAVRAQRPELERFRVAYVRLPENGQPFVDTAEFDGFDLDLFAAELRGLASRLAKPEFITPVAGEHCKYCPAFEHCPAQGKLLARMAANPEQLAGDVLDALTPELATKAYERVKAVEAVLRRVKDALYAYAANNPIPLADGHVFGQVETAREVFDGRVTRQVLSDMHGADIADEACDFETSKTAIERAMRVVYERRKKTGEKGVTIKALHQEALGAIRAAGGASVKPRTEWKEYRAELPAGEVGHE